MPPADLDLRRTWLFGPGAHAGAHEAMQRSGADVLIVDLEDFTPPARREEARRALAAVLRRWRDAGCVTAVRISGRSSRHLSVGGSRYPGRLVRPRAADRSGGQGFPVVAAGGIELAA